MTLQRNDGVLLRGPSGKLTHDSDCCCEVSPHCPDAICSDPTTLTIETSGFAADGDCDCIGFNDTFESQWEYALSECQWEIVGDVFDLTSQVDSDCYSGWDGVAALVTGQVIWNPTLEWYTWEAEITFFLFNGTAESPTSDYTLGTTSSGFRDTAVCEGDSVIKNQPANEACTITSATAEFTIVF